VIQSYIKELEAPRVADIGTGTGVWLTSLAQQLPKAAQLHGYDFDTSKFPTADMLPSNVKLGFGNVLEPFPRDVHGNYDLVHVRLLAFGMKKGDWLPAIRHVKDLLKPGGWLFWEETGEGSWGVMPPSKAFTELLEVEVGFAVEVAGRDLLYVVHCRPFNFYQGF
jgi:SAM-dependent methyltransferase